MYSYRTRGTCSREILFDIKDDKITDLQFVGGCAGNTQGVAKLCIGRNIDEIISIVKGIQCRGGTSCPDQLAQALEAYKESKNV